MARPTNLTKELTAEIGRLILEGHNHKQCQEILEIPERTWYQWREDDQQGFRSFLANCKHERMIKKAERKVEVLIDSEDEKVATSNAQFTLKTLGKEDYSERTDLTSKGERILILPQEISNKYATDGGPEENSGE